MTQQDLQGIADSLIPGSTVRDPGAFARFLEEKEEEFRAVTSQPLTPDQENVRLLQTAQSLGVETFPGLGAARNVQEANEVIRAAIATRQRLKQFPLALERREAATSSPGQSALTGLKVFGAVTDPFGELLGQSGAQVGGERFGTPGAIVGGLVGGAVAPIPRLRPPLGAPVRPGPGLFPGVEGAVKTGRGVDAAARSAIRQIPDGATVRSALDRISPVGTARAAGPEDVTPGAAPSQVDELEAEVAAVRERLRANGVPPRQRLTPEQELEAEVAARRSGTRPPGAASSAQPAGPRRVIDLIRVSKRLRPTVEEAIREQRRAGAEAGREAAARQTTALGRTRAFIGGQAGRRTSQNRFEPVAEAVPGSETLEGFPDLTPTQASKALGVTGDDFETMFRQVESSISDTFEVADAQRGLIRLLLGQTATPRQAKFLERVFGREMAEAARARTPLSALRKAGDIAYDVGFLLTKAFRSAVDASAMLRQAVIYTLNPRPSRVKITAESLGQMIRVGFARPGEAEKTAREVFTKITDPAANKWARQLYQTGSEKSRLYLQNPDKPLFDFTKREEAFASSIAETLPSLGKEFRTIRGRPVPQPVQTAVRAATLPIRAAGSVVRRSELMFGTYLNEVRNSIATHTLDNWSRAGRPITQAEVEELRRGINIFTGRGELGPLENSAKFLSAIFWSPRLWAARLEAPFFPLRGVLDPSVRRASAELAKDLVAFTTTGLTMLYLIDKTGLAQVESDPRSPNFGKIKVGNRTFDFWGGFQQQARYVTQLLTGERKTLTGDKAGEIEEVLPKDVAFNLIRSKLSPGIPTLIGNEAAGSTFDREPIRRLSQERQRMVARGQADSPNEIRLKTAAEQMVPLFLFDLGKAVEEEGAAGGLLQVPEALGVGVQTINEDKEGQR